MELTLIKNKLTFQEYCGFIKSVVDSVFINNEEGNIVYLPENYDLFLKLSFATYYLGYKSEGKDIEEIYNDCIDINIDKYISHPKTQEEFILSNQYRSMINAIQDKIEYIKQQILSTKKDSLDELLQSITKFVQTMENKFKDVDLSNIDGLGQLGKKIGDISDTKFVNALVKEISKNKIEK